MTKRHTLQWRNFAASTKSAFSPETIQHLSSKYGFTPDNVQALGMDLLVALRSPVKKPDARLLKLQKAKGEARRNKASKSIAEALQALATACHELSALVVEDAAALGVFDRNPASWQRRLNEISTALERLNQDLSFSAIVEHELADPTEHDPRLERDDVRISVVNLVFLFWKEQGRPLSLTTRSDRITNNITGALLDFARDVVADLTVHANILSADTLKADLKRARGQLEAFDESLPFAPPNAM